MHLHGMWSELESPDGRFRAPPHPAGAAGTTHQLPGDSRRARPLGVALPPDVPHGCRHVPRSRGVLNPAHKEDQECPKHSPLAHWPRRWPGSVAAQAQAQNDHAAHGQADAQTAAPSTQTVAPAADPHAGHATSASGSTAAPAMDHGNMQMQGGSAPPDARDPHGYPMADIGIGRLRRTRCAAADAGRRTQVLFVARRNSGTPLHAQRRRLHGLRPPGVVWDDLQQGRREGRRRYRQGKLEESRTELLWGTPSHRTGTPSSAFGWITGRPEPSMVGFRHPGPRPYWFELEATGYVGSGGRTALRVEGSYELLLTQRLILEPRAELQFYGKDDRNAVSARAWPKRLLACACAMNSVASSPLYRRGTGGQLRTHRGLCACRRRPCAADALGGWRAILVLEPSGFDHLMRGDP